MSNGPSLPGMAQPCTTINVPWHGPETWDVLSLHSKHAARPATTMPARHDSEGKMTVLPPDRHKTVMLHILAILAPFNSQKLGLSMGRAGPRLGLSNSVPKIGWAYWVLPNPGPKLNRPTSNLIPYWPGLGQGRAWA